MASNTENIDPMWKVLMKDVDFGEPTSFLDHVFWVALKENVRSARILWIITVVCSNQGFLLEPQKNYRPDLQENLMQKQFLLGPTIWKVARRNAWTDKTTEQFFKVATPCMDDHHFKEEEMKPVGELSKVSSQIVLKC